MALEEHLQLLLLLLPLLLSLGATAAGDQQTRCCCSLAVQAKELLQGGRSNDEGDGKLVGDLLWPETSSTEKVAATAASIWSGKPRNWIGAGEEGQNKGLVFLANVSSAWLFVGGRNPILLLLLASQQPVVPVCHLLLSGSVQCEHSYK